MVLSRVAAAAVVLYLVGLLASGRLVPHHAALLALVWALASSRSGPRRFVRHWWPMILFWVAYDSMRLLEPWILPRVEVRAPYEWERAWFKAPTWGVWPFYFAHLSAAASSETALRAVRRCCDFVYLTQLWAVPVLMLSIWIRRKDELFRSMVACFAVLSLASLAIYMAYPAAPPWWVYENGFAQPAPEHAMPGEGSRAGALGALFQVSPNRFAAVPSLHGAYPLLLTLVLAAGGVRPRYVLLAGVYAFSMWFACVFLNQHYIVDLLLGALLVPLALLPLRRRAAR
jgi:inositol phosphorylceramide synthase catalytic subunit